MVVQENGKTVCFRCGKDSIVSDEDVGELVCQNCGYVISEKIQSSGPEWRVFSTESDKNSARTGGPTSLTRHDKGLSTVISPINRDSTGRPLTSSMKHTIERLRTWDSRSQSAQSTDRNLRQALSELGRLKDKLAISPGVIESLIPVCPVPPEGICHSG